MKINRNEKLVARNATIGRYAALVGSVTAVGVVVFSVMSFSNPDIFAASNQGILLVVVLISFIITQASLYLGSRFGRRPRPDEQLDAALKGIPGDYAIYHYITPIPHVLVGPAGVWILIPYHQKGKIVYVKNRWKNSGGGFMQGYMRIFGQEGLGRPDLEAESQVSALEKFFRKKMDEGETPPAMNIALVFLDPNVEIEGEGASVHALHVKKLKELIRKAAKEAPFPQTDLERVKAALARS